MQSVEQGCKKCKQNFTLDSNDLGFYEKMKVPPPNVCPDCRFKRRALFRNEITLYSGRKCGLCGRNVISMYNPKSPYTIYCQECYLSDKWDPLDYGTDYDFSKPFFEQFKALLERTPKSVVFIGEPSVNSEYTNVAGANKDCYLLFNASHSENVMYSRGLNNSRDTLDGYFGYQVESCYEVVNAHLSSGVVYGQNSSGDLDSHFLLNTSDCQNCFGCVNMRHGKHQYFNQRLSADEYQKKIVEFKGSFEQMEKEKEKFEKHVLKFPQRESTNIKTVNSSGNYLFECKNVQSSFECQKCEDCKYCFSVRDAKDSYDQIGRGLNAEMLLEGVAVGTSSQRIIGCYAIANCSDVEYSFDLRSCANCFGCDSLRNANYCILNRKYSEKKYKEIREHIVLELTRLGEYGLFFPPTLAPFAYNESIANDNMPLTKEEALAQGFRWEDDVQKTEGKETLLPENIPDHIKDVKDSITKEILRCVTCNRNYKIIEQELLFYRKMVLPIPRKCFYCRHQDRIIRRGPYKFWDRNCAKCNKEITTNYAPDRPEIVYCEKCYQQEVY